MPAHLPTLIARIATTWQAVGHASAQTVLWYKPVIDHHVINVDAAVVRFDGVAPSGHAHLSGGLANPSVRSRAKAANYPNIQESSDRNEGMPVVCDVVRKFVKGLGWR
jgi:hypothetical protein